MSIEYGFRKTFTDYLDDVGGYYASPAILFMQNEDAANLSDRSNALYDYLANNRSRYFYMDWQYYDR